MGKIADKVATMRGCSLAQIVATIAEMEAPDLFGEPEPVKALAKTSALEAEFHDHFWPAYPHKTGKPVALRAFLKARKSATLDEILDGLLQYTLTRPPDRPWLNPSTFLNQERFRDQPAIVATVPRSPTSELRNDLRNRVVGDRGEGDRPVRRLAQR